MGRGPADQHSLDRDMAHGEYGDIAPSHVRAERQRLHSCWKQGKKHSNVSIV